MPKVSGKNLYVAYCGTVISNDIRQATTPDNFDTPEVSGGGDTRKSYVVGLGDTAVTLEGWLHTLTGAHAHAVFAAMEGDPNGGTLVIGPAGSTSGYPKQSGVMIVDSYEVTSPVTGAVSLRVGLKPTDGIGMAWSTFA